MAFTYNTLQAITHNWIAPRVTDNGFKGAPFTYMMKQNGRVALRGGLTIQEPIIKAALNYDWYTTGTSAAALEVKNPFTKAEYNWKFLRVPFALDEVDILKNGGDNGVVDIVNATEQTASLTMTDALATALHGTNSSASAQVDGLQDLFAASGTAYAGLTDTDFTTPFSWLTNIHSLLSAGALTTTDMRRMRGGATFGQVMPNLGLCNFHTYGKIWALAQGVQRFGTEETAKLGFDYVNFENMPIMADAYAPGSGGGTADNWLEFLNTDYLRLVVHSELAFKAQTYAPIPQQEVYIGKIKVALNLTTNMRRAHAVTKTVNPNT